MKKTFTLMALLLLCGGIMAQNGEILHENKKLVYGLNGGKIFDFDQDSVLDMRVALHDYHTPYVQNFEINYLFFNPNVGQYLFTAWRAQELNFGDTISQAPDTTWFYVEKNFEPWDIIHTGILYAGIRKPVGNGYCYGWIRYSLDIDGPHPSLSKLTIYEYAYCTIPDYPLIVGQTTFDWDMVKNEEIPVASIHPNPAQGQVTITGEGLKQAEAYNTLGQRVATAKGEGDQMTIDIAHLPTGLYFVGITDEQGRKCVRKVVKE